MVRPKIEDYLQNTIYSHIIFTISEKPTNALQYSKLVKKDPSTTYIQMQRLVKEGILLKGVHNYEVNYEEIENQFYKWIKENGWVEKIVSSAFCFLPEYKTNNQILKKIIKSNLSKKEDEFVIKVFPPLFNKANQDQIIQNVEQLFEIIAKTLCEVTHEESRKAIKEGKKFIDFKNTMSIFYSIEK